jgi:hypothetical protein
MKLRFTPLKKRCIKRFFKRLPMDSGLEWEVVVNNFDTDETHSAGI